MTIDKTELRLASAHGARLGGVFGYLIGVLCGLNLLANNFAIEGLLQGLAALAVSMAFGITLSAAILATTVPKWNWQPCAVVQMLVAPTLVITTALVASYHWTAVAAAIPEFALTPMAVIIGMWCTAWILVSCLGLFVKLFERHLFS